MVENVVDDCVEPKPAIIEASGEASVDVKPTVNVKFKFKIPLKAHIEEKPKSVLPVLPSFTVMKQTPPHFFNKGKLS